MDSPRSLLPGIILIGPPCFAGELDTHWRTAGFTRRADQARRENSGVSLLLPPRLWRFIFHSGSDKNVNPEPASFTRCRSDPWRHLSSTAGG